MWKVCIHVCTIWKIQWNYLCIYKYLECLNFIITSIFHFWETLAELFELWVMQTAFVTIAKSITFAMNKQMTRSHCSKKRSLKAIFQNLTKLADWFNTWGKDSNKCLCLWFCAPSSHAIKPIWAIRLFNMDLSFPAEFKSSLANWAGKFSSSWAWEHVKKYLLLHTSERI